MTTETTGTTETEAQDPQPQLAKATVHSQVELDALLAGAKGPVVLDFIQPDCPPCIETQQAFEKLKDACTGTPAAVARIDVTADWAAPLADKFKVEGTPTALFAKNVEALNAGDVSEVDVESAALRRKMKCAVK